MANVLTPNPELIENKDVTRELDPGYTLGNHELPIAKYRQQIETDLRENAVVILGAPTGSGKTTQAVQYAREMQTESGQPFFNKIITTQPRIVSARSVSERVADEIASVEQSHLHSVGYYTSKEGSAKPQHQQDIALLTDGKAARQLLHQSRQENAGKTLLIIDEVHEWNQNIELLVAITAERTDPQSPQYDENLTVLIMSATMNAGGLQEHYPHCEPPVIEVKMATHKVTHQITDEAVASVALRLASTAKDKVLAFYPGKREIARAGEKIEWMQMGVKPDERVPTIPLHGQQDAHEQRKAFEDYPNGSVIATTNAAETSLTVPGVVAVADSGQVRIDQIHYDMVATGSDSLELTDAAQASLWQRAGRCGRTGPGQYFLCSPDGRQKPVPFEERAEYETPAIQRSRLDGMLLHLRATDHQIEDFRFFHKPPAEAVSAARERLIVLGALDAEGNITERGRQMERLPLDPELACMIVFAQEQEYSPEVQANIVDIVAIMQLGGILKRSPKEQGWHDLMAQDAYGELLEQDSDFIAQLEAYVELTNTVEEEYWEDYDVNAHAVGLVEQGRASLAKSLNLPLRDVAKVTPKNRNAVLTCINAGQLNQLWRRNSEGWSLAQAPGREYEFSESSVVVQSLGHLATGSLFSLGLGDKTLTSIQSINRVPSLEHLQSAAEHLVTDEIQEKSITYDQERQQFTARIERKLGALVLSSFRDVITMEDSAATTEKLSEAQSDHAWSTWSGHDEIRPAYTLDDLKEAIENPEVAQYGVDPFSGEPFYAWRGGKGQWCRSKDVAVESLISAKTRLEKMPRREELRNIKEAVKAMRGQLIALKRRYDKDPQAKQISETAKALLSNRENTQDWLEQARALVESAQ